MTSNVAAPILARIPQATPAYDRAAMNNMVRIVEANFGLLTSIGLLRGNGIFLIDFPTDGHLLRAGEAWVDGNGFLRIVREDDVFSGTVSATGSVGTLTVTVT